MGALSAGERLAQTTYPDGSVSFAPVVASLPVPKAWKGNPVPIFSDLFTGTTLDTTKWNPGICSESSGGYYWNGGEFPAGSGDSGTGSPNNAEYYSPRQLSTGNGLTISATPDSSQKGYSWRSGIVCTYGKFALDSGIVRVRAQLPDCSTGAWPAIWFISNNASGDGEFDLIEGGMTHSTYPVNSLLASTYHYPSLPIGQVQSFEVVAPLTVMHDYDFWYAPGKSITCWMDDVLVANFTSAIISDPYQIVLDLAVATPAASSWHTTGTPLGSAFHIAGVTAWGT